VYYYALKMKKSILSRRRFLTMGSLGGVGIWVGSSDQLAARAVRGFVAETSRTILKPKFTPQPLSWASNRITTSWLGHSTVLINFYGMNILTDPVLGKRVGADSIVGTIGPKRLIAPGLKLKELPPVHREGRFEFFPREKLPGLKMPQTDLEQIWPWFWEHRGGFFAAHCHCGPNGKNEWTLEESRRVSSVECGGERG